MDGADSTGVGPGAVLDRISEGVVALDDNLVYTYANDGALRMLGLDREEVVGEHIWDVFPEAKDTVVGERIEQARATGERTTYERYNETHEQWFEVTVYPDGDRLTLVFRDVTDRKERESELEQYERIVESLPVAVGENATGEDGGFTSVNSAAVEMFEAESKSQLSEYTMGDVYVDETDREQMRETLKKRGQIEGWEVELETLSGDEFWASVTASAETVEDDDLRFIGIIENITERKRHERQLKQLHEATQELVAADTVEGVAERASAVAGEILDIEFSGVHLYDEEREALVPVATSQQLRDLLGEPPEIDAGLGWDVYQEREMRVYDDVRSAENVLNEDTPLRSEIMVPLGEHGLFLFSSTETDAFNDADVRIATLLARNTAAVLADRVKEQQLREHDRELLQAETLFENAQDAFFVIDADGDDYRIERINSAYEDLTGLDSDEIQGRTIVDIFGEEDGAAMTEHYDACVTKCSPQSYVEKLDVPTTESYWDTRIAPVVVDGEVVQIVGATRNVTEQKNYQQQLEEQRDGLELLNEMVRHDIRNDLQVIASYAELLATRIDTEDREYVERILNNAQSAVELTRSARDLAGTMLQTDRSVEPTPLKQTLLAQIDDIRTSYPDAVVSVDGTIPNVTVAADEMLASVFRNVIKNAIQHNDKAEPDVTITIDDGDDEVSVAVIDNGPGIPDNQKEEVFGKGEKGLGSEGTGIGLYLVNTLVEKYGGRVRVDDNEPEGTIVTVTLRRA
jgi:PAS domain S-box-containing protein